MKEKSFSKNHTIPLIKLLSVAFAALLAARRHSSLCSAVRRKEK